MIDTAENLVYEFPASLESFAPNISEFTVEEEPSNALIRIKRKHGIDVVMSLAGTLEEYEEKLGSYNKELNNSLGMIRMYKLGNV
jgi:hypothetical protein